MNPSFISPRRREIFLRRLIGPSLPSFTPVKNIIKVEKNSTLILWSVISPGHILSCPLVATWPEGKGLTSPCAPHRPRQMQAPSHSFPAKRKKNTHTHGVRYRCDRATWGVRFRGNSQTSPEACPRQEGVRSRSQSQFKWNLQQRTDVTTRHDMELTENV